MNVTCGSRLFKLDFSSPPLAIFSTALFCFRTASLYVNVAFLALDDVFTLFLTSLIFPTRFFACFLISGVLLVVASVSQALKNAKNHLRSFDHVHNVQSSL